MVTQGILSPAQRSQLSGLSPRIKLSVAQFTAAEKGVKVKFREILQKANWSADSDGRRIYSTISALGERFVTTNYDEWLDVVLPPFDSEVEGTATTYTTQELTRRTILHAPTDLTADKFRESDCVVHLHGIIGDPAGMVMTTSDYVGRYANDRHRDDEENQVLTFLENLFQNKTVLFLGYGLEELEILEYIIMKARASGRQNEASHYMVQGFFSFETELCNAMQTYFLKECGVELIPYLRDENDWRQLIFVLEHFARGLPMNDKLVAQELFEMKDLLRG
nr:SIR2 family protein [Lysobacter sp. CFH 32150]